MSKNLQKVQDMLDGNYKNKIQVGYSDTNKKRAIGEKWIDSDGKQWEQKDGYFTNITKLAKKGIFDRHCKDCNKGIRKPWDKDVHKADGRCYHCQVDYEAMLKTGKPLKWFAYRRLKDFKNMESIEQDMEQWIDELEKQKKQKVFDTKVANALANGEVNMTIKKNTL